MLGSTTSNMVRAATGKQSAHYLLIADFIGNLTDNSKFVATAEKGRECVRILDEILSKTASP